jgi:predicted transcriptional regulator
MKGQEMSEKNNKDKSLVLRNEKKPVQQMSKFLDKAKSLIIRKENNEKHKFIQENETKGYRSKLIICIDILCSLTSNSSINFSKLAHKVQLDTVRLIPHLKLLINRDLIEQQTKDNEVTYIITERGLKVLKILNPIVKEAHKIQIKNFEIISNTLYEAGYS